MMLFKPCKARALLKEISQWKEGHHDDESKIFTICADGSKICNSLCCSFLIVLDQVLVSALGVNGKNNNGALRKIVLTVLGEKYFPQNY
jgi:hypothetical protein